MSDEQVARHPQPGRTLVERLSGGIAELEPAIEAALQAARREGMEAALGEVWAEHQAHSRDGQSIPRDTAMTTCLAIKHRIEAAIRALPVSGAVDQWCKDMSKAPRDRTVLLAWGDEVISAKWVDNSQTTHPWAGWQPFAGSWPSRRPTAWMPLPTPPRAEGE